MKKLKRMLLVAVMVITIAPLIQTTETHVKAAEKVLSSIEIYVIPPKCAGYENADTTVLEADTGVFYGTIIKYDDGSVVYNGVDAQVDWELKTLDGRPTKAVLGTFPIDDEGLQAQIFVPYGEIGTELVLVATSRVNTSLKADLNLTVAENPFSTTCFRFENGAIPGINVYGNTPTFIEAWDGINSVYHTILPENPYYAPGYRFAGWISNSGKIYQSGDEVSFGISEDNGLSNERTGQTFRAKWERGFQAKTKGLTWIAQDNYLDIGVAYESEDPNVMFQWQSYNVATGEWTVIAPWSRGNWASWKEEQGDYWLHCEMKTSDGSVYETQTIAFRYYAGKTRLEGTYAGWRGDEVLIGATSTNPKAYIHFKTYNVAKNKWTYVTEEKSTNNWETWKPEEKGIYWLRYEIYTEDGRLADTKTYAFGVY